MDKIGFYEANVAIEVGSIPTPLYQVVASIIEVSIF